MTDSLLNLIRRRRSIRRFTGASIPAPALLSIVEAGVWAPTGCNHQELRFRIVDTEPYLSQLVQFKPFLRGVSALVLVFCDMSLPDSRKMYFWERRERGLCCVDTGVALSHMALMAESLGVAGCILNMTPYHFKGRASRWGRLMRYALGRRANSSLAWHLREKLGIPRHLRIMGGIALGYAAEHPDVVYGRHGGRPLMRRSVEDYLL